MSIHEIVLPETEPETEWILGRAVQKVSPYRTHGTLQGLVFTALWNWSAGRGQVASEWRFRIAPPGEIRRPLVPDVAYVANERFARLEGLDREVPPFAPDVAVEVLSLGDRKSHLRHKTAVYLAGGTSLVIVVDSAARSIALHDSRGVRILRENDVLEHPALPGFSLWLPELFTASLLPPA